MLSVVMPNVIILSVVILSMIMLNVVMENAVMVNVVMLNVVAECRYAKYRGAVNTEHDSHKTLYDINNYYLKYFIN